MYASTVRKVFQPQLYSGINGAPLYGDKKDIAGDYYSLILDNVMNTIVSFRSKI